MENYFKQLKEFDNSQFTDELPRQPPLRSVPALIPIEEIVPQIYNSVKFAQENDRKDVIKKDKIDLREFLKFYKKRYYRANFRFFIKV